jgi:hypothetical protein
MVSGAVFGGQGDLQAAKKELTGLWNAEIAEATAPHSQKLNTTAPHCLFTMMDFGNLVGAVPLVFFHRGIPDDSKWD